MYFLLNVLPWVRCLCVHSDRIKSRSGGTMVALRLRKSLTCFLTFLIVILNISVPPQVCAQVAGATISGTVTDASGAVVAGVQVSVRDTSTGIARTVTTDASGFYTAPNLQPGNYDVSATASGFSTVVQSGVTLTVGAQQVLNLKMTVGQVTETVQVTSEAPTVQLESSSISSTIEATTVRELPLNGRDWTSLATLQPGVSGMGSLQLSTNGFQRGNRGFGTQMAISGSRPQQNNFRLDGISVNDYVNSGPGSVLGVALGVDAIAEFSVISSNYSAEYGRTSGGVVNAVTRAGTNRYHGSAYYFTRDEDYDARNFFDAPQIPPFHRNQYGGSIGGPIRKDRTFFFADYEGLGQDLGVTNPDVTPSAAADSGLWNVAPTASFPAQCVSNGVTGTFNGSPFKQCAIAVNQLVQPYLAFWGPPQTLTGLGNSGIYSIVTQRGTTENFVSGRVDHKISDSDSLFGTYQYDRAPVTQPDPLNDVLLSSITSRTHVILEETHTFGPQFINSFRVGYNRSFAQNSFGVSAVNPVAGNFALGPDGHSAAPSIVVSGITSLAGGLQTAPATVYHFNDFQWYDDAFFTKGIHSIKFGFVAERLQENVGQNAGQIAGQYRFGSFPAFLANLPTSFRGNTSIGALKYLRQSIFGGYVQDDVRLRSNLTANLGLRYEMSTVPTEKYGALAAIGTPTGTLHLESQGASYFSNPTLRNFEPRVGFAWDPFKDGKTSVRGGFGVFDVLPLLYEYAILVVGTAPYIVTANATNLAQGTFPYTAYSNLNPAAAAASERVSYVQDNPKRNYVMQWNLNVQRQLAPSLSATVSFVGNRGVHMPFRADDGDTVVPTMTSAGFLWPFPVGSGTRPNTTYGRTDVLAWDNNSFFDALEVQVVKKMSHGFQVTGSYTWGKSIDLGSGSTHGDPFVSSISSDWFFNRNQLNRGLSDYNIGQNLVINYTWMIPSPHTTSTFETLALGGWQLGGIFTVNSGLPFTPQMGPDPYGTQSTLSYAFPNRSTSGPGCATATNPGSINYINLSCFSLPTAPSSFAAQCANFSGAASPAPSGQVYCANLLGNVGRNSLIGPGLKNFDFSLFKNFPIRRISESFNAQFRVEAFNIFNHPNFVAPIDNQQIFSSNGAPIATAGRIDSTSTTSRQMQFALKLIW
jgi:hypothetical protein